MTDAPNPAANVTQLRPVRTNHMPDRADPTVQLSLNDEELEALCEVLEALPMVKNYKVMPVLIDILNGNYIHLDDD